MPFGAFLSGGVNPSTVVALMQARIPRPVADLHNRLRRGRLRRVERRRRPRRAPSRHRPHRRGVPAVGGDGDPAVAAGNLRRAVCRLLQFQDPHLPREPARPGEADRRALRRRRRRAVGRLQPPPLGWEALGSHPTHPGPRPPGRWRRPDPGGSATLGHPLHPGRSGPALPAAGIRTPGAKVHKLVSVLPVDSHAALYQTLVSHWPDPGTLVPGAGDRDPLTERTLPGGLTGLAAQMIHLDQVGYLPDDILVKLDRAAMAVSLETRMPMLDHRAVELAWQVPTTVKLQGAGGKWRSRPPAGSERRCRCRCRCRCRRHLRHPSGPLHHTRPALHDRWLRSLVAGTVYRGTVYRGIGARRTAGRRAPRPQHRSRPRPGLGPGPGVATNQTPAAVPHPTPTASARATPQVYPRLADGAEHHSQAASRP